MTVINVINIEEYLYGVVPYEIQASSHPEALKPRLLLQEPIRWKTWTNTKGFSLTCAPLCIPRCIRALTEKRQQPIKQLMKQKER